MNGFNLIYPTENNLCVSVVMTLILYLLLVRYLKDLFWDLYCFCYVLMTYLMPQNSLPFTYLLMTLAYIALVKTLTINR